MRKGLLIGLVLVFGVIGCDNEEEAVGAFSSSLSAEEATVQNLTFTQQTTFCNEFGAYGVAKMASLEDQYGCMGSMADVADEAVETETTDPCTDVDYKECEATVAEMEACAGEYATNAYLMMAAMFGGAGDAAEGAAEGAEGMTLDFSALGISCDAPAPVAPSEECSAVAAKCPELFAGSAPSPEVELPELGEGGEGTEEGGEGTEEGGEAAEEGGEAAEEGGESAEEGGESAEEEGGESQE